MVRDGRQSRYVSEDEDHIDMRPLLRLTVWGGCAVIAVGVGVLAGRSEAGAARAEAALAAFRASPIEFLSHPLVAASQPSEAEKQAKQLADTVQALSADRDQLAARVATLERSLSDLTGSIARDRAAAASAPVATATDASNLPAASSGDKPEAPSPAPAETAAAEPAAPPETPSVAEPRPAQAPTTIGTVVNARSPRPGPLSTIQSYVSAASASRTAPRLAAIAPDAGPASAPAPKRIAVELAIATNVNALRTRWSALKAANGPVFEGLKPLVVVRPSTRPGFTEFHLVAGPVANAEAAARLCGALSTARVPCRPATYEGQSLELR
jgi:hypothetical protein